MEKHYCDKCGEVININPVSYGLPGHGKVYVINNDRGFCISRLELCMPHAEDFEMALTKFSMARQGSGEDRQCP